MTADTLTPDTLADEDALIDDLLRGSIDLHCHSGPSIMTRCLNHLEEVEEAEAAGMRAVLFKDHFFPTTPVLDVLRRRHAGSLQLLSGVPLNNALGGLNPYAVEHGLALGARLVWMPTLCAHNHLLTAHRYDLAGRLDMLPPDAISILTPQGELRDEVRQILDIIAAHDAVLCGGHLHISEMYPLFEEADARGVTRKLVSHPTFWIEANLDDLRELARMDVYLEHCACLMVDCPVRVFTGEDLVAYAEAAGIDRTILCSDLGQPGNPRPVEGFRDVIKLCLDAGFSPQDIRKMVSTNAARLVGLDDATCTGGAH